MFERLSLRAKIILGNAVSLLCLVFLGVLSLSSIKELKETDDWVDHTHRVIHQALQIENAAIDMETGMRGYLLAGDESFLAPYRAGKSRFTTLISELKVTVSDNPPQVLVLEKAETTIADWQQSVTENAIALRREIGSTQSMNGLSAEVNKDKGRAYLDRFGSLINTFKAEESALLSQIDVAVGDVEDINGTREALSSMKAKLQVMEQASLLETTVLTMASGVRGYLLTGNDAYLTSYTAGRNSIDFMLNDLKVSVNDNPKQMRTLNDIASVISEWQTQVFDRNIELRREIGEGKTMNDISNLVAQGRGKVFFDEFRRQIGAFIDREEQLLSERQATLEEALVATNNSLMFGVIAAILITIPIAIWLSRSIMRPFQSIFRGLHSFSSKELSDLNMAFNSVVKKMADSAGRLATVASSIDNVSQNLSQISNRQASSVEETSASTEEISGMVRINVQYAEESKDLSKEVGEKMTGLDDAMRMISESNHKIAELVKIIGEIGAKTAIIDDIVFQTKLLSFNASVEAERAGEHGRGFAVVAQEVGNLAQMSGKAATEISAIVKQSICEAETIAKENTCRVEKGSNIVAETRRQSNLVLEGASKIFDASNEQARGIQEISNAVESINKATQHAASIADQASSSSSELNKQAEDLNRMVLNLNSFLRGHETVIKDELETTVNVELRDKYEAQSLEGIRRQIDNAAHSLPDAPKEAEDSDNQTAWNRL
ncbi:chemotaxis protein [Enterovibrio norvegicus FF-33]|uniref:Chemotaxis protein n=1 Tax=Enterovibrio norvegicus FF-454 TaxID=1185651 RepID=A0A1E5CAT1_9GAMM|nr:CHASE3 domain-containing protein [Enterovibrio norvegicus]OEE62623.1 chemotaxis protein [Enterovibrio norvegicus FF-454]OEE66713.1 chemotaxis protein [Enterovibrio norvegicus FF-33]